VAGVNPVFFFLEVLLILAWRNAGWIGLDHWVLPKVGTPWQREVTVSGASGARPALTSKRNSTKHVIENVAEVAD
jgi:thiosulfate dehydrogenase [quinone] large subunit